MKNNRLLFFLLIFFHPAAYGQLTAPEYKQVYNRVDHILQEYIRTASFSEPKGVTWNTAYEESFEKLFTNENALIYDDINASVPTENRSYELHEVPLKKYVASLKQSFPNGIQVTAKAFRVLSEPLLTVTKVPGLPTEFNLDIVAGKKVEGINAGGASFSNDDTIRITVSVIMDPSGKLLTDQTRIRSISKIGESFRVLNDQDLDGVIDGADACPLEKGAKASNGCPDDDGDGINNSLDRCPNTYGSISNNGCPGDYFTRSLELKAAAGGSFNNLKLTSSILDLENNYTPWTTGKEYNADYVIKEASSITASGFQFSFFSAGADLNYYFKNSKKTGSGIKELSRNLGIGFGFRYTTFTSNFDFTDFTVAYRDDGTSLHSQSSGGTVFYEKIARFQRIHSLHEEMKLNDLTVMINLNFRKKLAEGKFTFNLMLSPLISLLSGESAYTLNADFGEIWQHDSVQTDWDISLAENWVELTRENYPYGYTTAELTAYFENLYSNKIADVGLNTTIQKTKKLNPVTGFGIGATIGISYFISKASSIGLGIQVQYASYSQSPGNYRIIDKRSVGYDPVFNGSGSISNIRVGTGLTYTINF